MRTFEEYGFEPSANLLPQGFAPVNMMTEEIWTVIPSCGMEEKIIKMTKIFLEGIIMNASFFNIMPWAIFFVDMDGYIYIIEMDSSKGNAEDILFRQTGQKLGSDPALIGKIAGQLNIKSAAVIIERKHPEKEGVTIGIPALNAENGLQTCTGR